MPRGISWSFNETEALIRLWADSTTQTALRLNSRNRCIYEDIANQLQAIGIIRTADQCQMRIKLLKKMYRQTNEALKRGDVFQQRPCPFYNEMHRIFSGREDPNGSSLLSNSQSLLNDDEGGEEEEADDDDDNDEIKNLEQENENKLQLENSNEDKFVQAVDRLIQYQKQNENRWYTYLEQQANLELQRRQEDRAYQLQLIQLLTNVISTKTNPSPSSSLLPVLQQLLVNNNNSPIEKCLSPQDDNITQGKKRKCSSNDEKKSKLRQPLPSNFYSLLAQIHNINNMDDNS